MVPEPRGEHNQEEKAMTTEKDPYLDKPECWLQLDIDDSVRRALIRHFLAFMGAGEGDFFEGKESIERQAWLLADAVIDNVKDEFAEQQYWSEISAEGLTAWLAERLKEEIAEVEKQHDKEVGFVQREDEGESNDRALSSEGTLPNSVELAATGGARATPHPDRGRGNHRAAVVGARPLARAEEEQEQPKGRRP
jgi:hypothetical protein